MSKVLCFLFHIYPSTYIAQRRATVYRKWLRIMWKRAGIFWCSAFESVKVSLYKKHNSSQKKRGGLCCFRRAKRWWHSLLWYRRWVEGIQIAMWLGSSSCCDGQRLGACVEGFPLHAVSPGSAMWVEGCCFPNLFWFFGRLTAQFCRMPVLPHDTFYTAYPCQWVTFLCGFHRAGCQFVLMYRGVQDGCHMIIIGCFPQSSHAGQF